MSPSRCQPQRTAKGETGQVSLIFVCGQGEGSRTRRSRPLGGLRRDPCGRRLLNGHSLKVERPASRTSVLRYCHRSCHLFDLILENCRLKAGFRICLKYGILTTVEQCSRSFRAFSKRHTNNPVCRRSGSHTCNGGSPFDREVGHYFRLLIYVKYLTTIRS